MARYLGLPTRLAVGYTPGDLRSDGLFHVYGRHGHTWPEVWFDGIGWVPFEPTPGRGSPDAVGYTGVAPEQFTGTGEGTGTVQTTPATVPPRDNGDPDSSTTVPGGGAPGAGNGATTTTSAAGGVGTGSSSTGSGVAWVVAVVAAGRSRIRNIAG